MSQKKYVIILMILICISTALFAEDDSVDFASGSDNLSIG